MSQLVPTILLKLRFFFFSQSSCCYEWHLIIESMVWHIFFPSLFFTKNNCVHIQVWLSTIQPFQSCFENRIFHCEKLVRIKFSLNQLKLKLHVVLKLTYHNILRQTCTFFYTGCQIWIYIHIYRLLFNTYFEHNKCFKHQIQKGYFLSKPPC